MKRIGVVDLGSNSTRLLIADVGSDGTVTEIDRRSQVTRLASGVQQSGQLSAEASSRVFATLGAYRAALDAAGVAPDDRVAILTSAVRDAANGAAFTAAVRDDFGLDARTITGAQEAELTFRGATSHRSDRRSPLLVFDIGGGSTELVVGRNGTADFHLSTQLGVVRQTERHLAHDPPRPREIQAIAEDVRELVGAHVAAAVAAAPAAAIAVAGTATSLAAIEQQLEPYDPARVDGYVISRSGAELALARLAQMDLATRETVPGLHPDRAPTIVAGIVILIEILRIFDLGSVEVSERDILYGALLDHAGR